METVTFVRAPKPSEISLSDIGCFCKTTNARVSAGGPINGTRSLNHLCSNSVATNTDPSWNTCLVAFLFYLFSSIPEILQLGVGLSLDCLIRGVGFNGNQGMGYRGEISDIHCLIDTSNIIKKEYNFWVKVSDF